MAFEGWQHVTSDYIILSQHVWESIINHIQNKNDQDTNRIKKYNIL
jgi:hypothetical protein